MLIRINDPGEGISDEKQQRLFHYYYSTAPKMDPTYTYSGLFGVPFTGLGCGLSLSRVYARYGTVHWILVFLCIIGSWEEIFLLSLSWAKAPLLRFC